MPRLFGWVVMAVAATACGVVAARAEDGAKISFNRDIRPILSDRCFACHGNDPAAREAELRLDTAEGAHEWAVVPGSADDSEVISRVASDDPEMRMPPVDSKKKPLTVQEISLLKRWIDQGAEYEPH